MTFYNNPSIMYRNNNSILFDIFKYISNHVKESNIPNKTDFSTYSYLIKNMDDKVYEKVRINNECEICYNSHYCIRLSCGHHMCAECMNKMIDSHNIKCPYCKRTIIVKQIK